MLGLFKMFLKLIWGQTKKLLFVEILSRAQRHQSLLYSEKVHANLVNNSWLGAGTVAPGNK